MSSLNVLLSENGAIESELVGYSDQEIASIAKMYDICPTGQLRDFLSVCGRSSGGIWGDDPIILFRPAWSTRTQFVFQWKFRSALLETGELDLLERPFVFSWEAESQYYYMNTAVNDSVFCYDENMEQVTETGMSLIEYLQTVSVRYRRVDSVCVGELIDF